MLAVRRAHGAALALGVAFVAAHAAVLAGQATGPLLWEVRSAGGTAFVLGSVHFGTASMYPLPTPIETAYRAADRLVVEVDVASVPPSQMLGVLADHGSYADGTSLADHVSAALWRDLGEVARRNGLPMDYIALQRPWLAALTITALEMNRHGYSESHGVDVHFLDRARGSKPIVELESFAEQMALFSELGASEQEALLRETVAQVREGRDYFTAVIDAWRAGDAEGLSRLVHEGMQDTDGSGELYERLVTARNEKMAARIDALLEEGGTSFVVVGAGHVVGPGGVPALLADMGHEVVRR